MRGRLRTLTKIAPTEGRHKVDLESLQYILTGIATCKRFKEISNGIRRKFKKRVSVFVIDYYSRNPKYKALIERERQEWSSHISDIAISHRRVRIEELSSMFYRNRAKGVEADKVALAAIRQVSEEINGGPRSRFGDLHLTQINYGSLSDEDLMRRLEDNRRKLKALEKLSDNRPPQAPEGACDTISVEAEDADGS